MSDDDRLVIHPQWEAWAARNLARGATSDDVVAELANEGVPERDARALCESLLASPALFEARALWRRVVALEQVARLRLDHRREQPREVERRTLPSVEDFVARYWLPGVPVVLTDLVTRWPAFARWSPQYFAEHFGHARVYACIGRTRVEHPDADWAGTERHLTVRELVDILATTTTPNDVYLIAKNAALAQPELRPLLDDIALPPAFFRAPLDPMRMALWLGGAGTHTPLHHDGDNSMFCQIRGRKRVRLAPPESVALLDRSRGVYNHWDPPDHIDDPPEIVRELVVQPGEALFIPAGWWHQVDALDPSISVTILDFAFTNDYGWYRPGTALRSATATTS
jgi:hypothetical protein